MTFQPFLNTAGNLIAHFTRALKPLGVTAIETGRIVKRPVFMDPHVQENCRAIFLRIPADRDDMCEMKFPEILRNALRNLTFHINPKFLHRSDDFRKDVTFRLNPRTMDLKSIPGV